MSSSVSPSRSRRLMASRIWWAVNLGFLPIFTPRALARSLPSPVRTRIRSLSNSASPPSNINRPCAVVVSAHASPRDRKPPPLPPMAASVLRRSRVDLASLSRRVTISTSTLADMVKGAAQPGPVGPCAARRLPENLFGSGLAQLPDLRVNALAVCRYPRIAVNHAGILHVIYAQKKGLFFNDLGFVHNS